MTSLFINAPFQTSYSIKTNCDKLVALLCLKYGKYISEAGDKGDFEIEAVKNDGTYEIHTPQKDFTTEHPLQEIDSIIFENTEYDERVFALHGAAVEWGGNAYLFLASTTSGKTTLASFLTSLGFGYITDDCILLDRESFRIYPYNTPIHLREGGYQVLKKYNTLPEEINFLEDKNITRHTYTPDNCVLHETPLGQIYFIKRTDSKNAVVDIQGTECMIELIKAPITNYRVNGAYIKFISRLAKTKCKRLIYSDMAYVAETIRRNG